MAWLMELVVFANGLAVPSATKIFRYAQAALLLIFNSAQRIRLAIWLNLQQV